MTRAAVALLIIAGVAGAPAAPTAEARPGRTVDVN